MPHVQDLGITFRSGIPGLFNTITVVPGVSVGSIGVRTGERQLNLLWAGTAVPCFAGGHVLNTNGDTAGLEWSREAGLLNPARLPLPIPIAWL